jgi:acetate kinase
MPTSMAVINAGSSSVKFAVYEAGKIGLPFRGQVEASAQSFDHAAAMREIERRARRSVAAFSGETNRLRRPPERSKKPWTSRP